MGRTYRATAAYVDPSSGVKFNSVTVGVLSPTVPMLDVLERIPDAKTALQAFPATEVAFVKNFKV